MVLKKRARSFSPLPNVGRSASSNVGAGTTQDPRAKDYPAKRQDDASSLVVSVLRGDHNAAKEVPSIASPVAHPRDRRTGREAEEADEDADSTCSSSMRSEMRVAQLISSRRQ